jgi:RNA polymerase sigma factor FliA
MPLDKQSVEELVTAHLDVAKRAAAVVYSRVREHCEFDELEALARLGLVEAAGRFDPANGASFKTFAWYRAYGAVIDGVRRQTNLPRDVWTKLVALRGAGEYLEHQIARQQNVSSGENASLATALADVQNAVAAIKTMYTTSLEAARSNGFDPAAGAEHSSGSPQTS